MKKQKKIILQPQLPQPPCLLRPSRGRGGGQARKALELAESRGSRPSLYPARELSQQPALIFETPQTFPRCPFFLFFSAQLDSFFLFFRRSWPFCCGRICLRPARNEEWSRCASSMLYGRGFVDFFFREILRLRNVFYRYLINSWCNILIRFIRMIDFDESK